jgi:hypothetical protein
MEYSGLIQNSGNLDSVMLGGKRKIWIFRPIHSVDHYFIQISYIPNSMQETANKIYCKLSGSKSTTCQQAPQRLVPGLNVLCHNFLHLGFCCHSLCEHMKPTHSIRTNKKPSTGQVTEKEAEGNPAHAMYV